MQPCDVKPPDLVPALAPQEVLVRQGGRIHRLKYHRGETLLETMRRGGVSAPHLCEQGFCGTCMVRLLVGNVALRENHVLSERDLADGYTLACQGVPCSTVCEIEIDG
jgi:3-ketosteroid 9alpha-monooxygenase subunit B